MGLHPFIGNNSAQPPIAGPLAWWDASQITGQADNTGLASWPDSSGNGHTLTQATGAKQPIYYKTTAGKLINGKPAVWFDGANTSMASAAIAQASPFTWIVVAKAAVLPPSENFYASSAGFSIALWETGTSFQASQTSAGNIGVADTALHMFASSFNSTTSLLALDGTTLAVNLGTAVAMSGAFQLGIAAAINTTQWNGPICELLIYAGAFTTGQMATCRSYAQAKWGTP